MTYTPTDECYARLEDSRLTIGNAVIERSWRIRDGRLHAVSFLYKPTGSEWIAAESDQPSLIGDLSARSASAPRLEVQTRQPTPVSAPALCAVVHLGDGWAWHFQIFPGSPGVQMQLQAPAGVGEAQAASVQASATGIESPTEGDQSLQADVVDHFQIDPLHTRLTQVTLVDQTDHHDTLVSTRDWLLHPNERELALAGNLFYLQRTLSSEGLIFLKLAPLPHARPVTSPCDLRIRTAQVSLLGHGLDESGGLGDTCIVLAYAGGTAGRIATLQQYQRRLRPIIAGRDGMFLSNTWGDRSRDARINEEFLRREIDAAARAGVDVVQIDDGWQRGISANSAHRHKGGVWSGFWQADPNFWTPHPERFPNGIEPIVREAADKGLRIGVWFAPDSSDDFANWQRDADTVLDLHRRLGISYFKIDGVNAKTRRAQRNLRQFFDRVLAESAGQVVFDLDVTAQTRPGYFGLPHVGPIFVENRYTDWRSYWPHHTLRNLWMLAHHVDPARLRFELLNPARNRALYGDDPLAPSAYPPDYLLAITLFANPLGWFEVSNLPEEVIAPISALARTWKSHRDAIFSGTILPIGGEPDGTSWTGFVSVNEHDSRAYAMIFRELNDQPQWSFLPHRPAKDVRILAGDGHAIVTADGHITVHLHHPLRYLFVEMLV